MTSYWVFRDADRTRPGSGFAEREFKAEDNQSACETFDRHCTEPELSLWRRLDDLVGVMRFAFVKEAKR